MKTNDLKKGTRIRLRNGWEATLEDNLKGNTRLAKVYGFVTEIGSIYSHDIVAFKDEEHGCWEWQEVDHTKDQLKLKETVDRMGF